MLRIATIALSLLLFTACTKKDSDTKADPAAKTNEPAKDQPKADEPKKDETVAKKDEPKADMAKKDEPKADEPKKDEPKKDEPAAGDATGLDPALEQKGLDAMKSLTDVFTSNAADCDKLAAGIEKFTADNKDTLVQIKEAEKKLTKEQKKAYDAKHKAAEKEMQDKMMPVIVKCQKNKNVEKAFMALAKNLE
jgi:hypothetical protein